MKNYRILSITDRKGNPRSGEKYQQRVGKMCAKPCVKIGEQMIIQWIANADGTPYIGESTTSMAITYIETGDRVTVTTRHSIYIFEKV